MLLTILVMGATVVTTNGLPWVWLAPVCPGVLVGCVVGDTVASGVTEGLGDTAVFSLAPQATIRKLSATSNVEIFIISGQSSVCKRI